ncbi:hypothetical protein K491DRAFT_719050 [Lophiostoma macrostomum CBS 122681]|uniref:Uncharacterized protein n=1 Tax=Lophiostoma macrostomum CBS 122681 TaxID=1314788 RepID=A0A6A6SZB9_9PLEO|nr:hypothetical protein K491DRAFT_719050 [Lophiostoma macrostomum CBS 122681]
MGQATSQPTSPGITTPPAASSIAPAASSVPPAATSIDPAATGTPPAGTSIPPAAGPMSSPAVSAVASGETATKPACSLTPTPLADNPLTVKDPAPTGGYGSIAEDGGKWGNVFIHNSCEVTLTVLSVGVYKLGGPRDNTTVGGLGSPCEAQIVTLSSGASLVEPYRKTCPKPDKNGTVQYCAGEDKIAGQGVSIKISNPADPPNNVFQMEYALVKDPFRGGEGGDKFTRFNYDVSLLDCAKIEGITDTCATPEDHAKKAAGCPGYKGGVAVTFMSKDNGTDVDPSICGPIYCQGDKKCAQIYTWDRTREGEASLACNQEMKGDMHVDLCVTKNQERNNLAQSAWNKYTAVATKAMDFPPATACPNAGAAPASSAAGSKREIRTQTQPLPSYGGTPTWSRRGKPQTATGV